MVFERGDPRFVEAMVYHWIDGSQRRVQALGFDALGNRSALVHLYEPVYYGNARFVDGAFVAPGASGFEMVRPRLGPSIVQEFHARNVTGMVVDAEVFDAIRRQAVPQERQEAPASPALVLVGLALVVLKLRRPEDWQVEGPRLVAIAWTRSVWRLVCFASRREFHSRCTAGASGMNAHSPSRPGQPLSRRSNRDSRRDRTLPAACSSGASCSLASACCWRWAPSCSEERRPFLSQDRTTPCGDSEREVNPVGLLGGAWCRSPQVGRAGRSRRRKEVD